MLLESLHHFAQTKELRKSFDLKYFANCKKNFCEKRFDVSVWLHTFPTECPIFSNPETRVTQLPTINLNTWHRQDDWPSNS